MVLDILTSLKNHSILWGCVCVGGGGIILHPYLPCWFSLKEELRNLFMIQFMKFDFY